jgi:hypothetical protein
MKSFAIFEMLILQPMNLNKIINHNGTTLWIYACFSKFFFCLTCLFIVVFLKKESAEFSAFQLSTTKQKRFE